MSFRSACARNGPPVGLLVQLNSTQLNSTQVNSTQLNSTQVNSTQLNSTQLNSTQLNLFNSTYYFTSGALLGLALSNSSVAMAIHITC